MKHTNKKGFTIVELVIVIAVIAILAAVLIPTFSNLIKKANESKDTQLIRNLNTALATNVEEEKTMAEALKVAADAGYDISKINASATDNQILWDSVNNVFCYLQNGAIKYIPENSKAEDVANVDYWVIASEVNPTYSTYLVGYTGASVEALNSLDVSACGAVDVVYNGSATVSVFTNGGNITVNGGTVNHYGMARYLTKTAGTYNEFGTLVADLATVEKVEDTSTWTIVNNAEELTAALVNGGNILLGANISVETDIEQKANSFEVTKDTVINLNGFNITGVHINNNDTLNKNNVLINVTNANLTLEGYGIISLKYEGTNMAWNALSSTLRLAGSTGVINVNDAVVVDHLGGTPMSYAIDCYASGNANTLNVNGGALLSSYIAVRWFFPNADSTGTLNINNGVLSGVSREIWAQGSTADNAAIINIAETYKVTVDGVSYFFD